MNKPDISHDTLIGRDWVKSLALPLICLFVTGASVYGVQIEPHSYYEHRFHSGSFIALPVFSVLTGFAAYRLLVPFGPLLRLTPTGFADRRAGRGLLPWGEITNVVRRGEFISLTMSRKLAKSYRLSLTQRLLKSTRKNARPSHILVADWCLKTRQSELLDLITGYRNAYLNRAVQA